MKAIVLLGSAAFAALATSPAVAQQAPASVLQRLDALEAKVNALEARNAELERQLAAQKAAPAAAPALSAPPTALASSGTSPSGAAGGGAPVPSAASGSGAPTAPGPKPAPAVSWSSIAPQFSSPDGNFTFKPRGILDVDVAGFHGSKGGYQFGNGTQIRRGRFGFDGTLLKQFAWRVEAEYVGGSVTLLDAYVAYTGTKDFTLTLGQLKIPAGLEANSSDAFNEFLERGMANTAFGAVGGERRVGVTLAYANPFLTVTGGVYGANEAVGRNATTHDEPWSVNGRITLEPVNAPGRLIHVGASGYRAMSLAANSVTLSDRPNVRVDNGLLESVAITGNQAADGTQTGVKNATFYGLEGAGVFGPFSVQGEYSHMHLDRYGVAPSLNFDGYYVFGSFFLTGEARSFRGGTIDRLRPIRPFDPAHGNWGAWELAARYDRINLTDHGLSPLNHDGHAWTAALNWYLTGNVKILMNYIHFKGENSPLVATPASIYGTTAEGDAFAARLHLDF